ncbi:MAG: hypothetical protein FJW31_03510 [Acidobacteria bacterium]|nr:hypothetical protein [Acidobacteriota bacterium]
MIAREFDVASARFARLVETAPNGREKAGALVEASWVSQRRQGLPEARKYSEAAALLAPSDAGVKLRMALVQAQTAGQVAASLASFGEAEALFRAATNLEGVAETLWQQSRV